MSDPVTTLAEIRRIYFATTPATIHEDFDRAMDLLKSLSEEADRQKASVYMEGLIEMRREWSGRARRSGTPRPPRRPKG